MYSWRNLLRSLETCTTDPGPPRRSSGISVRAPIDNERSCTHIGAYTCLSRLRIEMPSDARPKPEVCNCLALREATRHVTQFYDRLLASSGLRTTQFSILIRLRLEGPMPINALAKSLVMDRTTLGRNILPLAREGLIEIVPDSVDRRSKVVRLTEAGAARLRRAAPTEPTLHLSVPRTRFGRSFLSGSESLLSTTLGYRNARTTLRSPTV